MATGIESCKEDISLVEFERLGDAIAVLEDCHYHTRDVAMLLVLARAICSMRQTVIREDWDAAEDLAFATASRADLMDAAPVSIMRELSAVEAMCRSARLVGKLRTALGRGRPTVLPTGEVDVSGVHVEELDGLFLMAFTGGLDVEQLRRHAAAATTNVPIVSDKLLRKMSNLSEYVDEVVEEYTDDAGGLGVGGPPPSLAPTSNTDNNAVAADEDTDSDDDDDEDTDSDLDSDDSEYDTHRRGTDLPNMRSMVSAASALVSDGQLTWAAEALLGDARRIRNLRAAFLDSDWDGVGKVLGDFAARSGEIDHSHPSSPNRVRLLEAAAWTPRGSPRKHGGVEGDGGNSDDADDDMDNADGDGDGDGDGDDGDDGARSSMGSALSSSTTRSARARRGLIPRTASSAKLLFMMEVGVADTSTAHMAAPEVGEEIESAKVAFRSHIMCHQLKVAMQQGRLIRGLQGTFDVSLVQVTRLDLAIARAVDVMKSLPAGLGAGHVSLLNTAQQLRVMRGALRSDDWTGALREARRVTALIAISAAKRRQHRPSQGKEDETLSLSWGVPRVVVEEVGMVVDESARRQAISELRAVLARRPGRTFGRDIDHADSWLVWRVTHPWVNPDGEGGEAGTSEPGTSEGGSGNGVDGSSGRSGGAEGGAGGGQTGPSPTTRVSPRGAFRRGASIADASAMHRNASAVKADAALQEALSRALAVGSTLESDVILASAVEVLVTLRDAARHWDWPRAKETLVTNAGVMDRVAEWAAVKREDGSGSDDSTWSRILEEVNLVRAQVSFSEVVLVIVVAVSRGRATGGIGRLNSSKVDVAELQAALSRADTMEETGGESEGAGVYVSVGGGLSRQSGERRWEDEPFRRLIDTARMVHQLRIALINGDVEGIERTADSYKRGRPPLLAGCARDEVDLIFREASLRRMVTDFRAVLATGKATGTPGAVDVGTIHVAALRHTVDMVQSAIEAEERRGEDRRRARGGARGARGVRGQEEGEGEEEEEGEFHKERESVALHPHVLELFGIAQLMLELRRTWKSGDSPGLARATQRCVAQLYTLDHANTGTQRAIARILRDEVELARDEVEFRDLLEELNIPRSRGISAIARFGGVEATRREVASIIRGADEALARMDRGAIARILHELDELGIPLDTRGRLRQILHLEERDFLQLKLSAGMALRDADMVASVTSAVKTVFMATCGKDFELERSPAIYRPVRGEDGWESKGGRRGGDGGDGGADGGVGGGAVVDVTASPSSPSSSSSSLSSSALLAHSQVPITRALTVGAQKSSEMAARLFKQVMGYMGDRNMPHPVACLPQVLAAGVMHHSLRDELYVQLMKQLTDNPSKQSRDAGWRMLERMLECFPPSEPLENFLEAFLRKSQHEVCIHALHKAVYLGARVDIPDIDETDMAMAAAAPQQIGNE